MKIRCQRRGCPLQFSVLLVAVVSVAMFGRPVAAADECEGSCPPYNIVLFISDDHGFIYNGFMGHPAIQTPTLDRLAINS